MKRPYVKRAGVRLTDEQRDLAARHFDLACRVARAGTRDEQEATDAAVRGLILAVQGWDPRLPLANYVRFVVRHEATRVVNPRRPARRTPARPVLRIRADCGDPAEPRDDLAAVDDRDAVAAALSRLPPADREAFVAIVLAPTWAEAGRAIGADYRTAQKQFDRIRRRFEGSDRP